MCYEQSGLLCTDPTALKGYLAVLTEFAFLQRYLMLKYKGDQNKKLVFNDPDYVRYCILYISLINK